MRNTRRTRRRKKGPAASISRPRGIPIAPACGHFRFPWNRPTNAITSRPRHSSVVSLWFRIVPPYQASSPMINGTPEASRRLLSSGCRYVYIYLLLPGLGISETMNKREKEGETCRTMKNVCKRLDRPCRKRCRDIAPRVNRR